jgi:hypothetical protein
MSHYDQPDHAPSDLTERTLKAGYDIQAQQRDRIRALEADLTDWQRMRNEAMAVATSNMERIVALEADLAAWKTVAEDLKQGCLNDEPRIRTLASNRERSLERTRVWLGDTSQGRGLANLLRNVSVFGRRERS